MGKFIVSRDEESLEVMFHNGTATVTGFAQWEVMREEECRDNHCMPGDIMLLNDEGEIMGYIIIN